MKNKISQLTYHQTMHSLPETMHSLPGDFSVLRKFDAQLEESCSQEWGYRFLPFRFGLPFLGVVFRDFLVRNQDLFYQKFFPVSCKPVSIPALLGQGKRPQIGESCHPFKVSPDKPFVVA